MKSFISFYLFFILIFTYDVCKILAKKRPNQVKKDKAWQSRKTQCEDTTCIHLLPEEAYNCVNNCTSPSCYDAIYAQSPLEDGEVDYERNRQFTTCVRKEQNDDWVSGLCFYTCVYIG